MLRMKLSNCVLAYHAVIGFKYYVSLLVGSANVDQPHEVGVMLRMKLSNCVLVYHAVWNQISLLIGNEQTFIDV